MSRKRLGMRGVGGGDSSLGAWRLPGAEYFSHCNVLACTVLLFFLVLNIEFFLGGLVKLSSPASRGSVRGHVGMACGVNL